MVVILRIIAVRLGKILPTEKTYKRENNMGYKDDYKDYKTGDWYEIERGYCYYDPDDDVSMNDLSLVQGGFYRQFFEQAEIVFECKATVYDYHNIYLWALDVLTTDIVFDNLLLLMDGSELSITYEDIVVAFEKEKKKLDAVFQEFASKLETPADLSIKNFPEKADKKEREILNKMGKYLIDRELLSNGKYKLTRPIFCKQVVKELIKHGYNENSGLIFMNQFIEYHVEPATIQNYFRTCKKDIPINRLKNV
jgi:hypothetical protein